MRASTVSQQLGDAPAQEAALSMTVRVGINGFGRIGRLAYRAMVEQGLVGDAIDVVAVGDIVPADNLAYLVKYDSTQGTFPGEVTHRGDDTIIVNGDEMKVVSAREPSGLPWKELGVDVVIESTGLFTAAEKSQGHVEAGAKKVIISAKCKERRIDLQHCISSIIKGPEIFLIAVIKYA